MNIFHFYCAAFVACAIFAATDTAHYPWILGPAFICLLLAAMSGHLSQAYRKQD